MKKTLAILLTVALLLGCLMGCAQQPAGTDGGADDKTPATNDTKATDAPKDETTTPDQGGTDTPSDVPATPSDVPFEVGEDTAEYVVDGSAGWTAYDVYVKIVSGDDVLFNGTVSMTSDNMFVSEVTFAAITEKGISSDGVQAGFVNSIGDYVAGNDADGNYLFWGYTVNGKYVSFACNQMRVLEGDYILWEFQKYDASAAPVVVPSGITAPFEVGEDTAEYVVDGSSGWTAYDVYVKIVSGDDVLFNGTVSMTSDNMFVSEATFAAITEKGISSDGVQAGFVNSIGDYVAGNDADGNYLFWGYTVNGKYVSFACNQLSLLEGDYVLWEFQAYAG